MTTTLETDEGDRVDCLVRLVAALRRQCNEKEEIIGRLLLQEEHHRAGTTQPEGNRRIESLLNTNSKAGLDYKTRAPSLADEENRASLTVASTHTLRQLLAARDRELESQRVWINNATAELESLKLQARSLQSELTVCKDAAAVRELCAASDAAQQTEHANLAQMRDVLQQQGAAFMGFAGRQMEQKETEIETLQFELLRRERTLAATREELAKAQERAEALQSALDELQLSAELSQQERGARHSQAAANARAIVALSSAQIEALKSRCAALERRLSENEEQLRQKDHELQDGRRRTSERESAILALTKHAQAVEFQLNLSQVTLKEAESEKRTSEQRLREQLRQTEEESELRVQLASEQEQSRASALREELTHCVREKEGLGQQLEELSQQREKLEQQLQEQKALRVSLEGRIADLEAERVIIEQQRVALEVAERREQEYKAKLQTLTAANLALRQDSLLLQETRKERAHLQKQLLQLQLR